MKTIIEKIAFNSDEPNVNNAILGQVMSRVLDNY
jgi:hypothetical protein